jgi:hypothetical protein
MGETVWKLESNSQNFNRSDHMGETVWKLESNSQNFNRSDHMGETVWSKWYTVDLD